ncbi:MAG: diacylglycerol/lipid kinase family protein [Bacillota bacterium]
MDNKRSYFIVNPAAAHGKARTQWPELLRMITAQGTAMDWQFTDCPGHATSLAQEAAQNGFGRIVAVGGDGTVNEVVEGLANLPDTVQPVLGIVGLGTGNDLIKTLGIPLDPKMAIERLQNGSEIQIDLGSVRYIDFQSEPQQRYFANIAALGFAADVVVATNAMGKWLRGTLPYLLGLAKTFATFRNQPMRISYDGRIWQGMSSLAVIANCQYFGGGMKVAPQADPSDGFLDLVILENLSKAELARHFPKVYRGDHLQIPQVKTLRGRQIEITSETTCLFQVEGDVVGTTPVSINVVPRRLKVIV